MSLYDSDFHAWAKQQAELVRLGRFDEVDREQLAEEIEALGKSEAHSLQSAYRLIAMHLLKMMFQPEKSSRSWRETIIRERANIGFPIEDFPGLKPRMQALFEKAYPQARHLAAQETGLPIRIFPNDPPFTRAQVEAAEFMPVAGDP